MALNGSDGSEGMIGTTGPTGSAVLSGTGARARATGRRAVLAAGALGAGAALAGALSAAPAHAGESVAFTDVAPGQEHAEDISWLAATGITTGYPDGSFHPLESIERGAMAAFLYRFAGSPEYPMPSVPLFVDVAGSPFRREIAWLKGRAVTFGWTDGTFRPTAPVARDAMAAFLHRLFAQPLAERGVAPTAAASPFPDVPATSQFAVEIGWLAALGVTQGYEDGSFRPLAPVARDAMAAFLHRMDDVLRGAGY
ncbi:S-layer homology domain-containing protein [Brachybacterium huguangmaarense]